MSQKTYPAPKDPSNPRPGEAGYRNRKFPELPATGDRIRCIEMRHDAGGAGVAPGTEGTVQMVDDAGTIHVLWDNGSSLGLISEQGLDEDRSILPRPPGAKADLWEVIK